MVIYKITNLKNNKIYIGKTIGSSKQRWNKHVYHYRNGTKRHLYNSMRKYGINNFALEVIEKCLSIELLNEREKY